MSPEKIERIVHIGDFFVRDGKILATDPSRQGIVGNEQVVFQQCQPGLWHAFIEDDTAHTYKLIAISATSDPTSNEWVVALGQTVFVETCQAGLFDASRYNFDQKFYERICDLTVRDVADVEAGKVLGIEGWCFEHGAVTGTAIESGECLCYAMTNSDGVIFGVAIMFYKSYMEWENVSLNKILKSDRD